MQPLAAVTGIVARSGPRFIGESIIHGRRVGKASLNEVALAAALKTPRTGIADQA
jgi:hypothetical protein